VTTISLSRWREKTHETCGFPFRAFVLSLALHALVLGALAKLPHDTAATAVPLHASLRAHAETGGAEPTLPHERHARQRRLLAPEIPGRDAVSPAQTLARDLAVLKDGDGRASGGGFSDPPIAPESVTVALAAPSETRGPDAAGLRQYRLALAGEARRFRSYPESARRAGATGTAEVRVLVSGAAWRQTELARSSGHAELDAAAIEMLRAAAAQTPLPDSLRGQEFAVLLPVLFAVEP
jgi:periplasmic protein TonB